MVWQIQFDDASIKDLAKLDKPVARRITVFLRERVALLDDRRSIGEALKGSKLGELGVWAAEGVDAKGGPSEDSFCRVCRPIAVAMGQKAGKKWTAAAVLQPTFLLPPTLLGKYRVGDYRIIASIEDGALLVLVVRIGNRRDVYR